MEWAACGLDGSPLYPVCYLGLDWGWPAQTSPTWGSVALGPPQLLNYRGAVRRRSTSSVNTVSRRQRADMGRVHTGHGVNTASKKQDTGDINILICTSLLSFSFLQTITLLFKLTFSCKIFISFFPTKSYKGKNKILFWQMS